LTEILLHTVIFVPHQPREADNDGIVITT